MAQDNTVSFKAYLLQGSTNEKSEVRRFGVDRDVVSSFDYLKEKLQHVFPTLRNQNFSVMWKDGDDDDVVISSDDELMIALSEMQNDVRRLYIKVLGTSAHPPNTEAGQTNEATEQTHKGVICDGCNQQIEGFRYHCTDCFDYDLCGICEAKKMHREHIMIRLPMPIPTHVLHPYMGHLMAHLGGLKGHHGRDRRHHHDRHGRGKWCPLNKTMGEMLASNSDDLMREMFCSADEDKQQSSAEKSKQNVSAEEMREKMKTKFEKIKKTRGKKAEYLWSVGQKIAEFLDPWGIDVDVEVLTRDENENKNEEGKKEEERMETEETEKDEMQNKEPKGKAGEGSNEAGPSHASEAGASNSAAQSERANPETDDWTVLNAAPAQPQQENSNPPEPTIVGTSANQVQNGTGTMPTASSGSAPMQATIAGTSANQVQNGTGTMPTASSASAPMRAGAGISIGDGEFGMGLPAILQAAYSGVGTTGMLPSGASAPTYIGTGMASSDAPVYVGLRTGMPPSGANTPVYAGAGATVPSTTGAYNYGRIYPNIPSTNIPPMYLQATQNPVRPRHAYNTYTRPHVADAVQKMMAMGFSNEGGWLTQLLEIKNGDIEKALDVLQPVKKS